jgi:hypothetical protein
MEKTHPRDQISIDRVTEDLFFLPGWHSGAPSKIRINASPKTDKEVVHTECDRTSSNVGCLLAVAKTGISFAQLKARKSRICQLESFLDSKNVVWLDVGMPPAGFSKVSCKRSDQLTQSIL